MRSWRAKRIFSLGSRDLVSCVSEMHRTRLAREQQLRWDEEKGPEMTTTITITTITAITVITAIVAIVWGKKPPEITVTYLILGGLFPREVNMRFWGEGRDATLAFCAPDGAFAFLRSDRSGLTYLDGEVLPVEELETQGDYEIARGAIADGARSAVRLKGTNMWCPFFRTDRVVMTDR